MSGDKRAFELLLLTIERDLPVLSISMPYVRRFLSPARITIIASSACLRRIEALDLAGDGTILLDEDEAVAGLTLGGVRSLLEARGADPRRAGWYFKQILNLCYAMRDGTMDQYLTWDTDTIPVRPIPFFDEAGRALYARKSEHHEPYFATMRRLIGIGKIADFSFIAEHMLFDRSTVLELLNLIQRGRDCDAGGIASLILDAVDDDSLSGSGFAEYETYGTFAMAKRPDSIAIRDLPSSRRGSSVFGRRPAAAQLFALSTRFYWASFEPWPARDIPAKAKRVALRVVGILWAITSVILHPFRFLEFMNGTSKR